MYVLAADSDPVMCKVIKFILSGVGHEVATATSGAELVTLAQSREPDLFLLDTGLGDVDCRKVGRALQENGVNARALFLVPRTASGKSPKRSALPPGECLCKPFEPDQLIRRVGKFSRPLTASARAASAGLSIVK